MYWQIFVSSVVSPIFRFVMITYCIFRKNHPLNEKKTVFLSIKNGGSRFRGLYFDQLKLLYTEILLWSGYEKQQYDSVFARYPDRVFFAVRAGSGAADIDFPDRIGQYAYLSNQFRARMFSGLVVFPLRIAGFAFTEPVGFQRIRGQESRFCRDAVCRGILSPA